MNVVGIRARDVRAVVQEQHPETVFTRRDIYNARALINCDKLDGYTPTAALIKLFDETKIPYLVKWDDSSPDRLLGIVWTFPYCIKMWKRFPEVMSFDNTYNTNRFKLPLFQATGQTCLGSVYNAAFGLIDNERREGFQFLSESIRQLTEQHRIRAPDVIITDFDDAMKAALDDQFPGAQQQLCIHHINSNGLLKAKQRWVTDHEPDSSASGVDGCDEEVGSAQAHSELSPKDRRFIHEPVAGDIPHSYRGVLIMWKYVMFAETEEAHEKAWCDLCREFDDQRAILQYLHRTYMPVRAQWARCFIRKYRNFGIRVTSGTEASNNNVKSYLLNGMSNLYRLVEAIQDMISDQERDFAHASAEDEVLTDRRYLGPSSKYLGDLPTTISSKAIGLIARQHRTAERAMPTGKTPFPAPLGECGEDCSVSVELGIPCCHKIYAKMGEGATFTKWDVHPRWHLRESTSRDRYRRILDPKITVSLRGRPKNTTQAVPARLGIETSNQSGAGTRRDLSKVHGARQVPGMP
ncbi:mutator-like element [Purpureocillium lavendulum]|uniref:Mutator-like element n=1 Tax=Purpureocillium lavendulum TaxID=1247861 RepID=A0AB34FIF3_9HYPO|nr:mutator-like element [Purpureocillium lavendulum]